MSLLALLAASSGARSDDEASGSDVKTACETMCKGAGYTWSRIGPQPNETNCFCEGGSAEVTATACTDMCAPMGKPGQAFGANGSSTKNACQCQ